MRNIFTKEYDLFCDQLKARYRAMRAEDRERGLKGDDTLRRLEGEAPEILRPIIEPFTLPADAKISLYFAPGPASERRDVIPDMHIWDLELIAPWEKRI